MKKAIASKLIYGFLFFLFSSILMWAAISYKFKKNSETLFQAPEFTIHDDVLRADLELGKRIFTVRNGCVDCHGSDLAGVKVIEDSAIGTIYGANITPVNLKSWTDEQIATAIRYGLHKSGRSLRFMPSTDYEGLSKSDIAALIAFIRSVPEVVQSRPDSTFGPIAKILSAFGQMPIMFPAFMIDVTKGFAQKPVEGPTVEFGQYLANSCTGCHGAEFRGGKVPGGDPSWPEASNIRMGSNWTEAKFVEAIKTGISPITGKKIRPPMPMNLIRQMNEMEIKALWSFLSSLK